MLEGLINYSLPHPPARAEVVHRNKDLVCCGDLMNWFSCYLAATVANYEETLLHQHKYFFRRSVVYRCVKVGGYLGLLLERSRKCP